MENDTLVGTKFDVMKLQWDKESPLGRESPKIDLRQCDGRMVGSIIRWSKCYLSYGTLSTSHPGKRYQANLGTPFTRRELISCRDLGNNAKLRRGRGSSTRRSTPRAESHELTANAGPEE